MMPGKNKIEYPDELTCEQIECYKTLRIFEDLKKARGQDLLNAVKEINAKMLYPIHTEHPESYEKITSNITLVKEGKKYTL